MISKNSSESLVCRVTPRGRGCFKNFFLAAKSSHQSTTPSDFSPFKDVAINKCHEKKTRNIDQVFQICLGFVKTQTEEKTGSHTYLECWIYNKVMAILYYLLNCYFTPCKCTYKDNSKHSYLKSNFLYGVRRRETSIICRLNL